jgi:hypothetical protein
MRCLLCAGVFLVAAGPLLADQAKANTLTSQEIKDGWILLFDGETTFAWTIEGSTKVENGALVVGGEEWSRLSLPNWLGTYELHAEFRWKGDKRPLVRLGGRDWPTDWPEANTWVTADFKLIRSQNGPDPAFARESYDVRWKDMRDRIFSLGAYRQVVRVKPIDVVAAAGCTLELRNLKVKPLDLKPIFNGKDLKGWKEFPGKKSKFNVTPEGWLNIKNGPGDLQTEDQWNDFILQVECISNGERLNSGVFFRCRPGEYQNGYEAQIHNGFTATPTKEYRLQEYDPLSHRLVSEKAVKYTATDYGTGAIYRRMPARRQVAKDREWFTMTVLARGNHMAVWVNGIQVTDWTDNRPSSDNARTGCRLEKGPISLQGHDKTTDLSFRNIRIAALPASAKKEP